MYSLLDGLSKPSHIKKRIDELELPGTAISEHGNVASAIPMLKTFDDKQLILGNEFYISQQSAQIKEDTNRKLSHLPLLAKNDAGWKSLVKLTTAANLPEHFYYKPRLSLEELAQYIDGNIIGFSGHLGSDIANRILGPDDKINPDAVKDATNLACWFRDTFGKDNFWLEVQLMESHTNEAQRIVSEIVRQVSINTGIPCIATPDAHYAYHEDAKDQRILLCTNMQVTLDKASRPDFPLYGFFKSNNFHIPSYDEMISYGHTEEELTNTLRIADSCSKYEQILRPPMIPTFKCPDGLTPDEYLKKLAYAGLDKHGINDDKHRERLEMELKVFRDNGLSSYFLIVRDFLHYVVNNNWLIGISRGSAGGCLLSYVIDITYIDPLEYDLLFERFFNESRKNTLPDFDADIPAGKRDLVIDYIKNKYGHDKVGQMISFQTMQGRSALKDVFRAYGDIPHEEQNRITKFIPDKNKISDDLQEMKEETGDSSIIRWSLENHAKELAEWCYIAEDGSLKGELADKFAQAIRLEGTKTNQSKHAAGIVIGDVPLGELCPMVYDPKTNSNIAGFEMNELADIGLTKYDILGLNFLDKIMCCQNILAGKDDEEDD